jgi:tape measure domain-containing protein
MAFTVDIRGNASHLEKTLKSVKTNLNDLATTGLKGVTAGIAAFGAAGAAAIGAFVVTSSQAAASLEDLAIQFEVLTGSAQASKDLLKAFREEEQKSALNTEDYANAAKTFLAFGGSLEDTLPSLKMLADVSMGNSERLGSLALAFAQTTAAGRLMGQEVLQFVNAGFNPLEQIARDTGKSMAELKKEMEDGKISVSMVRQAFINATSEGGRFFGAIDKGSATTSAKLNQTRASVTRLQVAFGTGFNEGLKDALDATNNFLPQLEGKFSDAGNFIGAAISDSLVGDNERFKLLGQAVGDVFVAGMKAAVMTGLDNLGESMGGGIASQVQSGPNFGALGLLPQGMRDKLAGGIREAFRGQTNFVDEFDRRMQDTGANASVDALKQNSEALKQKIADDAKYTQELLQGNEEMVNLLKIISGKNPMSITGAKFTN